MTDINKEFNILENRLDQLISECNRLRRENQKLQTENKGLNKKHSAAMDKNRLARARIDSIISRLNEASQG